MTNLSKTDAKTPDAATLKLREGFEWTTTHSGIVITAIAIFLVVGASWSGWNWYSNNKEMKAFDAYAPIERDFLKKKEQFDLFESTKVNPDPKNKDFKPQGVPSTGKIEEDYGNLIVGMKDVIKNHPSSSAAHLSALSLSSVFIKYKLPENGLDVLNQLRPRQDLVGGLTLFQKARLLADKSECGQAIPLFEQVAKNRKASFLAPEARMKTALCYEKLNQKDKAEETYTKIISEEKDSPAAKSAEKFLRLLQLEKNSA